MCQTEDEISAKVLNSLGVKLEKKSIQERDETFPRSQLVTCQAEYSEDAMYISILNIFHSSI